MGKERGWGVFEGAESISLGGLPEKLRVGGCFRNCVLTRGSAPRPRTLHPIVVGVSQIISHLRTGIPHARLHSVGHPLSSQISFPLVTFVSCFFHPTLRGNSFFTWDACVVVGRGAEPPQFWMLLIWLQPGISHVTWVHYDATLCLACFVCSILPVLHFLRIGLFVL